MTIYEIRLNGQGVAIGFGFAEMQKLYEEKKLANPSGFYELYRVER